MNNGRKQELHMSQQMRIKEDSMYEEYKASARRLLIKRNAADLLPMLGLEEGDQNGSN